MNLEFSCGVWESLRLSAGGANFVNRHPAHDLLRPGTTLRYSLRCRPTGVSTCRRYYYMKNVNIFSVSTGYSPFTSR